MKRSLNLILVASTLAAAAGCAASASHDNSARAVVEAKFAAVNRHAVADIVNLYSPDAQITASDFCKPRQGRADVERIYRSMFEAYPSIVADVQEYFVAADRVAVRFIVRIREPGKTFDVPIADFFTVRDGLIVSDDGVFDVHGRPCSP